MDGRNEDWITCKEFAAIWGVTPETVARWCAARRVPGAKKAGRDWRIPRRATPPRPESDASGERRAG